jgi:hypothetical protein
MGIVTCDLSISLDGCSAGPNQSLDHPSSDRVEGTGPAGWSSTSARRTPEVTHLVYGR